MLIKLTIQNCRHWEAGKAKASHHFLEQFFIDKIRVDERERVDEKSDKK